MDGLAGHCGTSDVLDVVEAAKSLSTELTAVSVIGGSHGGFLAGHLIGQYPAMFRAAVLRNPVINIASMISGTDITEWCAVEALGLDFETQRDSLRLNSEKVCKMFQASPINYAEDVTTPTMVVLGKNDRRVPPFQGKEMYFTLKRRGIPTRMLVYDDPHPIEKVESNCDCWINIALWFDEHDALDLSVLE